MKVTAFTDGSYSHPTATGGWGVYTHYETLTGLLVEMDDYGHVSNATSSGHTETIAIWNCLMTIPNGWSVELWGDNQYTIRTMVLNDSDELRVVRGQVEYSGYMKNWNMATGMKRDGPIKNVEWWRRIDAEVSRILSHGGRVKLNWMRGHGKDSNHPHNYGNERADMLASKGAKMFRL